MSDQPRGPGWWLASDGRYYPPELHPSRRAPRPQKPPEVRQPAQPLEPADDAEPTVQLQPTRPRSHRAQETKWARARRTYSDGPWYAKATLIVFAIILIGAVAGAVGGGDDPSDDDDRVAVEVDDSTTTTERTSPTPTTEALPIEVASNQLRTSPALLGGLSGNTPNSVRPATLLEELVVAPKGARGGYDDELFDYWGDADGDGCDTRCEVLEVEGTYELPGLPGGGWLSIYDGYSTPDAGELDIDHLVPLAEAWDSGAAGWTPDQREAYANDLGHPGALLAVTAATNRSKGDRDPAEWQPPNRAAWCAYAIDWVSVKVRWGLTADQAEVDALRNMLDGCLPNSATALTTTTTTTSTTAAPTTSAATQPPRTQPPATNPPPVEETTTTTSGGGGGTVHPGAFCSPAGATGFSEVNGVPMTCATESCEGEPYQQPHWRRTDC